MKEKFDWSEYVREAGALAVRAAFGLFVVAMAFAVYLLGETFGQPQPMRLLVAAGCSIGIFGHGVAATATRNGSNAGRMMHGIALGTWLLLSLFLASLYALTSSERLAKFVPDGMADIGAVIYALCFGIGLFTSTLALVVPAVAARPLSDSSMPTLGSAIARFGEPLFIILCIGASSLHLFTFGMDVARVGMFSTVAAMVVADLSFLVAEKRVLHEVKVRHAAGHYDKFDLIAWGIFGLLVLCYLVMVNVYSVRHTAGTLNASDPLLKTVIDFYGASPTLLILSMAALALITAFVDVRDDGVIDTEGRPMLSKLAGNVKAQRLAFRELREALSAPQPAQIAAPSQMDMAERDTVTVRTVTKTERPPKDRNEKTRKCRWCKTSFTATDGRAQYCSSKCRKAASRSVNVSQSDDHE